MDQITPQSKQPAESDPIERMAAVGAETRSDDTPLFSLFKPRPDDSPAIQRLRLIVMAMGALLVVLFMTVIGRVYYLMSHDTSTAAVSANTVAPGPTKPLNLVPAVKLRLPANARITAHALSGNVLSIHYTSPTGDGIMLVDLTTGRPASHVSVAPGSD